MKTSTTFRSDDEYWAWLERRARLYERLYNAARCAALFAFGIVLVFVMLWFCVRNMGAGHYNHWHEALRNHRSQSG